MTKDYEIPANAKWIVRRDPCATPDMQWAAHWPTGITVYAATAQRVWERMREECWMREGVRL